MIDFNSKIEIEQLLAWMDGGSITLKCRNDRNQKFEIEFTQNLVWDFKEPRKIPGRLYVNGELIEQRSQIEKDILENIKAADKSHLDSKSIAMIAEKISYIESEDYMNDKKTNRLKG